MKLFQQLKAAFNYGFYSEYRFRRVVRHRLMRFYSTDAPRAKNTQKMVIAMFDGRKRHGGLADRLRGICTTYCFCREQGIDFRLHFSSPFRLEEFLVPNQYDWRIAEQEISYNALDAHPVYIASPCVFCQVAIITKCQYISVVISYTESVTISIIGCSQS